MTTMTTMMMMMMVVMMSSSAFVARAENPLAPRLRDERIVLQTTLGDLTLALYDDAVAPATAARVLALFDAGAYATIIFSASIGDSWRKSRSARAEGEWR